MSTKLARLMAISFLLLLLTACSQPEQTPQVAVTVMPVATLTTFESPLVAPTATQSTFDSPVPVPTRGSISSDKAAVKGLLVLTNPEFVAPQEDGLYLVVVDTESVMVMPAVDPETSIQAEVDEVTGQFFFDDVGEGLYAFVVLTDRGQQLSVRDMQTGVATIVTVSEENRNTVIDLGRLRLP